MLLSAVEEGLPLRETGIHVVEEARHDDRREPWSSVLRVDLPNGFVASNEVVPLGAWLDGHSRLTRLTDIQCHRSLVPYPGMNAVKAAGKRAGVPWAGLHTLPHTAATLAFANGWN